MKVTHICTSFSGGAGICAQRIMEATAELGVDTRALVAFGAPAPNIDVIPPHIAWSDNRIVRKLQALRAIAGLGPMSLALARRIAKEQRSMQGIHSFFSSPATGYTDIAGHPWVQEADIIHLHWIGNFVDYESFFPRIKQPIVWTAHDENPALGGFHYSSWKQIASESFRRLDDALMRKKRNAYERIESLTLVALSNQMSEFFGRSQLVRRFPRVTIHNGVDGRRFRPMPRSTARAALDIPEESVVFLFSAQNIHEERKGLNELIAALESLRLPGTTLICLGNYDAVPRASFAVRCEGFVPNSHLQSVYYSAADFFALPSLQEAFAQTPLEAMACGCPVIAFPCSGTDSLITEENGVVCRGFTSGDFLDGIRSALSKPYDRVAIRRSVLGRFSMDAIARSYVALYGSLLK